MSEENGGSTEDFPTEVDEDLPVESHELVDDDQTEDSLANAEDLLNATAEQDEDEDASLESIKARMAQMEEEANKLTQYTEQHAATPTSPTVPTFHTPDEKKEIDSRSIYVGNVDYGATAEELETHFHGCGSINRVTINCDKYTGHPKGFAYVEFSEAESVENAAAMDESLFRGRQIKVTPKRTNIPGHSTTNRPPRGRGRGYRSRGFRGGYRGRYRGGYRGRGRGNYYSPY
ncbi:uncharacterized protein [Watersipora subatra]|uniref:uncharacterized protein n=1 Tax=Watersipora subatra TaxID=2589382 RepID=UPI00355C68B1